MLEPRDMNLFDSCEDILSLTRQGTVGGCLHSHRGRKSSELLGCDIQQPEVCGPGPNPSPFIFRVEIPTHFLTQTNFFYFNNNNETVLIILSYKKDSFEDTPLRRTTAIPLVPSGLFSEGLRRIGRDPPPFRHKSEIPGVFFEGFP